MSEQRTLQEALRAKATGATFARAWVSNGDVRAAADALDAKDAEIARLAKLAEDWRRARAETIPLIWRPTSSAASTHTDERMG